MDDGTEADQGRASAKSGPWRDGGSGRPLCPLALFAIGIARQDWLFDDYHPKGARIPWFNRRERIAIGKIGPILSHHDAAGCRRLGRACSWQPKPPNARAATEGLTKYTLTEEYWANTLIRVSGIS
jgi:hypothetical protein